MKKLSILFVFIMIMMNATQAQLPVSAGLKIGINSSVMPTKITNMGDVKDQAKTGFLFGAFARINLPVIYLQPELYYTKKGGDMQYLSAPNIVFTQQTTLKTIDVPLLIGVKLINLKAANLRVMTGPVVSFITSKDISYQLNGIEIGSNTTKTGNYKNTIWGLQAGAGIDVLMFTLDIRYEWGLNNISDYSDMNAKTRLFHIALGMKLF